MKFGEYCQAYLSLCLVLLELQELMTEGPRSHGDFEKKGGFLCLVFLAFIVGQCSPMLQVGWEAKVQGCTRTYISIGVLVD